MKKKTLLSMLAFFCLAGSSAWAQAFTQNKLHYEVKDADARIVSVIGAESDISGSVVIPSTVTYNGATYTVTKIGNYAFSGTNITAVTIPGTVMSLGERAFGDCHGLAKITFEESDEPLSFVYGYEGSFQYCDHDKEVIVNRNVNHSNSGCPFYANVTSAVIGGKATTVADYLFHGQGKMTSISIGNSVTSIGNYAFYDCGAPSDEVEMTLTLSDNLTTIGENAFFSCEALKSLTLPSSLKLIGGSAFSYASIASIVIPESIDSIGESAFESCQKLTSIRIEDSDKPLRMREGYYRPFHYCGAAKTVYLGRNLILSENSTPFETSITSVEIGDKVTVINPRMFADNTLLTSVTIGKGVKSIEYSAFYNCGNYETVSELTVSLGENTTRIGEDAFRYCTKLKSIALPASVKTIEASAFSNTGLTDITIPATIDSLGQRAFGECGNLTNIRIENKTAALKMWNGYYGSFAYSDAEKTVYVGRDLQLNDNTTVFGNPTSVTFGDNVTTINPSMFYNNGKLASVTIGKGVKTIGSNAFYNCGSDESVNELTVTMGENINKISELAFYYCKKLTSVNLPSSVKVIETTAFSNTGLTSITIPATVDSLGLRAFGECGDLTSIRIEDNTTPLKLWNGYNGTFAFSDAGKTVYVGRDLLLNDNTSVFGNPTSVTFGDNVTTINPSMFYNNGKLASVTIGKGVKTIGSNAFYNCGSDESVNELTVTMGENLSKISEQAFYYCKKLTSVNLPSSVKVIETNAFSNTGLTSITIPASADSLGLRAFGECGNLTNIRIEDNTTPLKLLNGYNGTFAFSDAEKTVYVGRDLQYDEQGSSPFSYITSATIGSEVTSLKPNELNSDILMSVQVPWQTPIAIQENVFSDNTYQNGTLLVPGGTMNAYKADEVWSKFLNIEASSYFVTGTATKGGTLAFADLTVTNGSESILIDRESDVTFTVAPEANYDFTSLTVNGEAVEVANNTYTYPNLLADIDVKATFTEKPKFDIKATATGGTLSLNGANFSASQNIKVYRDTDVTLAIAADEGYEQPKVTVNGQDVTALLQDNQLKIENIQEAKTIVVTYVKKKFQIATEPTQNGSIELSKNVVEWGDSFTATFVPATGYALETATLDGADVTAQVVDDVLTVTNVKANKTVGATFMRVVFNVTISGGGITVSNSNPRLGDNVTVTIDDDPDLTLVTLLVNGQDVTAQVVNGQYVIQNVTGDVTIEATFKSTKEFITMTGEYATFSCPQDLNFTGCDLRAYIAAGFNKATNQVLLVRVYDVPAGTGLFLVGEPGTTYKVPYSEASSIYMNFLQANLQKSTINATTGNFSNYIFGEQDGDLGFYPIEEKATLLAQTAYLQLPSSFVAAGVKVSVVFEDDVIDGIEEFRISDSDAMIYDLAGRRLGKTKHGINIVNGKKILVK